MCGATLISGLFGDTHLNNALKMLYFRILHSHCCPLLGESERKPKTVSAECQMSAHELKFQSLIFSKIVRLGEYDESTDIDCIDEDNCADPFQDVNIQSFIAHPSYDPMKFINDIGIVRLEKAAATAQNNIKFICLPFDPNARKISKKFIVIGEFFIFENQMCN
jgi:hypothetical protein